MPSPALASRRTFVQVPPLVSGYPLDNVRVSFYVPQSAVNLVTNPSIELATTNFTAVGGSIARSATRQRFGTYSLAHTPTSATTDGVFYGGSTPLALVLGTIYFASVYGYFAAGVPYQIYFASTAGALVGTAYTFRGRGRWERVWVSYQEMVTSNRRLYVTKNGSASTRVFYLDGFQVEQDRLTSYLDGNQSGFVKNQVAYYWTGAPHASASVRVQATRAGGIEVKLSDYGFSALALVGLGLGGFLNLSTPNSYVGGAQFERTVYTERVFDIAGVFQAPGGFSELQRLRSDLGAVLRPNAGIISQPCVFRFQTVDDTGYPMGDPAEMICTFEGGLQGNLNNNFQEPATLTFKTYAPALAKMEGEAGAVIAFQADLAVDAIAQRDTDGNWSNMDGGTLAGDIIYALLYGDDGKLYAAGIINSLGGVANTVNIGYFDPSDTNWHAMGTGALGGEVFTLAKMPDGKIVAAGAFTSMGGVANTNRIALWDPVALSWSSVSSGFTGTLIRRLSVAPNGSLYVAGQFSNIGGTAMANVGFRTAAGVWTAMSTGLGTANVNIVYDIIASASKTPTIIVNAVGDFTSPATRAAIWDGTIWRTMGAGLGDTVYELALGPDGSFYAGGEIGIDINRFNGVQWVVIGITSGSIPLVQMLYVDPNGTLFAGVSGVTTISNLTLIDSLAAYNQSTWINYFDIDLPTANPVLALAYSPTGVVTIAGSFFGTAGITGTTSITNAGSADTSPILTLTGPGQLFRLINNTTGDALYFNNFILLAGEVATLDLRPGHLFFGSNFRPNLLGYIQAGSAFGTFRLTPGANSISAFIAGDTAATAIDARWDVNYLSVDDALYR